MPSPNDNPMTSHGSGDKIDASHGYERSDASTAGIFVFLISLGVFVAVSGFLCYGIGKVFNAEFNREDGPNTKWTKTADTRQLGDFPSSPELQNKIATLTEQFPTPRLLTDDGDQDIADLHAREDLLLDHYTAIAGQPGKVRIPIERAMELIAQRGLPVMPAGQEEPLMTGDNHPVVTMPLTTGFARTAYEIEQRRDEGPHAERPPNTK